MPSNTPVSLAFVDGDGRPLDVSAWTRANIWMAAVPAVFILASVIPDRMDTIRGALGLGTGVTLLAGSASRVWKLVHDSRHRDASRDWWLAHHAQVMRRTLIGGAVALILLLVGLAVSLAADATYLAALLVAPTVGSVAVLTFVAEVVRQRRPSGIGRQLGRQG